MPRVGRTTNPTAPLAAGQSHALVRSFKLEVVAGPDRGAKYASTGLRTVLGTHRTTDFVLRDPAVSRFHCEISIVEGKAVIKDLQSKNGTQVDGVGIREGVLTRSATLVMGQTRIKFKLGGGFVRVPVSSAERFGLLSGGSRAMRTLFPYLEAAAQKDTTVLIEGETGTGKDLAAQSIHLESSRRGGPFVVIDCGSIPPALMESELFGHEKGAFTGAVTRRTGAFQAASGGTLFLDEIGELGLELQPKLLRALESRQVTPVGGGAASNVDLRVIAATNRDLREEVNAGRFRSDLYFRLAVLEVRLPPLRERLDDLPVLVDEILAALEAPGDGAAAELRGEEGLARLARHAWPGNVRELRNYVGRCVALAEPPPLEGRPGAAPRIDPTEPLREAREKWIRFFEREYLEKLLASSGNNVAAAARAAGVDRVHMHRLLARAKLR